MFKSITKHLAGPVLAMGLVAPAAALDIDNMSDAEREIFREEIRNYLLENPEVIMEAVSVLEQRDAVAQAQADEGLVASYAEDIFNDDHSWNGGNPQGDITLVEFLDYRCGFCKRAHGEIAKLLEADGNIRLIVKEFPILGEQSMLASRFAVATKQIAGDDAYKSMADALMSVGGNFCFRDIDEFFRKCRAAFFDLASHHIP